MYTLCLTFVISHRGLLLVFCNKTRSSFPCSLASWPVTGAGIITLLLWPRRESQWNVWPDITLCSLNPSRNGIGLDVLPSSLVHWQICCGICYGTSLGDIRSEGPDYMLASCLFFFIFIHSSHGFFTVTSGGLPIFICPLASDVG